MATILPTNSSFSIVSESEDFLLAKQKVLIVGQQIGSVSESGVLVTDIGNDGVEDTLFGEKSMIATMIREFKRINQVVQLDAIPLDDAIGSIAAEGDLAFAGTATAKSTFDFIIQSKRLHSFSIDVDIGDDSDTVATAVFNAINADPTISVIATNSTPSEVIIIATNAGTIGNSLGMRVTAIPDGISLTSFCQPGNLVPGSGDPDVSGLFDAVGDTRYQTIVWPENYDNTVAKDFIESRFNVDNAVLDGIIVSSKTALEDDLISDALSINSISYVLLGNQIINQLYHFSGAIFEFDPVIAAQFAAIRSLRLSLGANVSQYVTGAGIATSFGGPAFAATAYKATPFNNISVIEDDSGWSRDQQSTLNDAGVSFLGNDLLNSVIIAGEIVTTGAQESSTFKFLDYMDTASVIREYFFNSNKIEYAPSRLTIGDQIFGVRMVNITSIAVFQSEVFNILSSSDSAGVVYQLTQSGDEAQRFFKDNLDVSINITEGSATINAIVPIVTQLRELDGTVQIVFDLTLSG
jgi:hypothetical protein